MESVAKANKNATNTTTKKSSATKKEPSEEVMTFGRNAQAKMVENKGE